MTEGNAKPENTSPEIIEMQERIAQLQEALRLQHHMAYAAGLFQGEVTIRNLIESFGEGFLVIDGDQRIILINHQTEEMMGYRMEELVGQGLSILLPERFADIHQRHVETYLQFPYVRSMGQGLELTARRKEGSEFPVEVSLSFLDTGAGRFGLAFITDVTLRKQIEQTLLEQNEALNSFAQTVAHDLQSSVTVLLGLSELLTETHAVLSETDVHQQLQSISRNAQRISRIIHELLLLASLRKEEVVLQPVETTPLIESALDRLAPAIQSSQAEIVYPKTFPRVLGYAPWLEEVWFNYLSNALKYGGRPPQIEIGSTITEDGLVEFWVKDNGPGIPAEHLPKLFTSGQRLEQTRAQGNGLGLSIVNQIIQKLNGRVGVDSVSGQGSVFSFSLTLIK